jgi:CBS domain containing-hemolysin-like protein
MSADITILSALCLFFLAMSAFFSASETAIFSIPRERIELFKTHESRPKRLIYELLMDGQRTLLFILLANLFVNITLTGVVNSLMTAVVGKDAALWSFVAATASIIVFGEVLPKNAALHRNEGLAAFASPILFYLMKLLSPLLNVALKVNHFFLTRFTSRFRNRNSPFITIGELKSAVRSSFEQGVVSKSEQGVITNLLEKGAQPAKRIMTHRSRIPILPHYATAAEALTELSARNQTFALITRGPRNSEVTGIVTLPDLLKAAPGDRCRQLAAAPQWAPETIATADLLSFMFAEKINIVCIVDEFGGLSGALTLMDGLSKVMSSAPERPSRSAGNARVFTGLQEIDTITEWLPESLTAQVKDARTLNGLLTRHLGRIPKTGERFDIGSTNFYIMYAGLTRIESVLIVREEQG